MSPALVLAACLVALAPEPPRPQATRPAARFAALERVVLAELAATHTPGAALAIIHRGRLIYARGFGVASVETGAPVTPATLFRLGSTTKMLTGAALVQAAAQGKLRLDAPIGERARGLTPRLARLTAHQLLSNTAGVADFPAPLTSHDDDALSTMIHGWRDDVLFGEPGRIYSYASPGFWLAGYVLEEAGGKPYADVMDELVFRPAGMTRTTLRPLTAMTYPLALGHDAAERGAAVIRPAFDNAAMWPAGSVFSSAQDLARFALALVDGGRLDAQQVFPDALLSTLAGEYVDLPGDPGVHYGYGLLSFTERGVRTVMHGGFSRGYGSMLRLAPAHGFALIVLTNRSGETLPKSVQKALELILPLAPETAPAPRVALALEPADLRRFVGVYANGAQTWEIRERDGQLVLHDADGETPLVKTGPWRLSPAAALDLDVAFVAGAGGRAEYIFTGLYAGRRRPDPPPRADPIPSPQRAPAR